MGASRPAQVGAPPQRNLLASSLASGVHPLPHKTRSASHRPAPVSRRGGLVPLTRLPLVVAAFLLAALVQRSEQREPWSRRYAKLPNLPILRLAQVDTDTLSKGEGALEALFLSANASFTYHLAQREVSFMRDRVTLKRLDRWSEPKMRELFLVPNYPCPMAARVGEWGEGGKWLCNIFPFVGGFRRHTVEAQPQASAADVSSVFAAGFAARLQASRPTVVYSIGSRDETSFELAMYQLLNVKPLTLDPSLSEDKQAHLKSLDFLEFHNLGLKGRSGRRSIRGWGQLMRITQVMSLFNHSYIDVLKIDCEGCEVGVMKDLLATFGREPPVGQVLMEIHHLVAPGSEIDLLLTMEDLGFRMFHSENNERYLRAHEVAYVHESLVNPSFWP